MTVPAGSLDESPPHEYVGIWRADAAILLEGRMEGLIEFESEPGRTVFTLLLPLEEAT